MYPVLTHSYIFPQMSDVFPHTPFGLDPTAGAAAAHEPGQSKGHAEEGLHGPGPQASGQAESAAGLGTTICGCGSNIGTEHGALVGLEPGTKTCGRLVV